MAVDVWDADMLEMDVRATADGRVVVIHDPTVDRTCDGSGSVHSLPWEAIAQMDAGYHFRDLQGEASYRGEKVRIPLFEEVLQAFPEIRLNVEAKERRVAPAMVELIRRHGAVDRVLVAAEHERARRDVRDYGGPWGASRWQVTHFWVGCRSPLGWPYTPHADVLQVPETQGRLRVVDERFIREAHRRNLPVHVWVVDDPDDMNRLLHMGVDGIQTDRPDVLARVLCAAGRPPPPGLREGERV
jgi:glycerophosphoryl diester phosphodiesterase